MAQHDEYDEGDVDRKYSVHGGRGQAQSQALQSGSGLSFVHHPRTWLYRFRTTIFVL